MSDVREFGAVGDGQADDTEAIEHALKDGEGTLSFPRGEYRISRTIVVDLAKTGVTALEGHGTARLIMAAAGAALRIIGTHLKGTADPGSFDAKSLRNERMPCIDGLEIAGEHADADGIEAMGTMQLTITRTRITGCRHGVRLYDRNRNVTIGECHIYDNRGCGILYDEVSLHQSNIVGTHVSYCGGGGIVFRGGDVRNVHIGTCDLESNHDPKGPPTANILVDCTTSPNGTAEVAITGCTIQHNSKSPGSANIRYLGRGSEGKSGRQQWGHLTIVGNVFSDVMTNVHLQGCRDVTLTGNTFWMGYEHDLLVEDCTGLAMAGNALGRNPAYAYGNTAEAQNAVIFRGCRDCAVSGLYVQGVHTAEAAVVVEACDRFNLSDSTIVDNDKIGLLLRKVTRSRISGCLIRDDREAAASLAIKAVECRDCLVTGNYLGRPSELGFTGGIVEGNYQQ
jgi:hypothetical protein